MHLVRPHAQYEASFRRAFAEMTSESDREAWIYLGQRDYDFYFQKPFSDYVRLMLERETNPPSYFVKDTAYWAVVGDEVVGRIAVRHTLNEFLKIMGGHVGYIVRPSARGKGYATEMLRQVLATERAREIGSLLLTCDEGNLASERTIRRCGGVLEDVVILSSDKPRKMRFWIDLHGAPKPFPGALKTQIVEFARTMLHRLGQHELLSEITAVDHACYRVADQAGYERWKATLTSCARLLTEAPVNGRPIASYKLPRPILIDSRFAIDVLELPAPKPGSAYPEGVEHIEVVTKGTLQELIARFAHLDFDIKNLHLLRNRDIQLRFAEGVVKFHEMPLEQIIAEEAGE